VRSWQLVLGLVTALPLGCEKPAPPPVLDLSGPVADWPDYGRGKDATAFSPLSQITPENVAALTVAWEHHSGDVSDGTGDTSRTSFQARAIVPNGTLYYCSGLNKVFALDPETGKERWRFDPKLQNKKLGGPYPLVCRGVAYWKAAKASAPGPDGNGAVAACSERILTATIDSELIALDAATGEPCGDFGAQGRVDLRQGFEEAPRWEAYVTSPPLVLGDVAVVGGLVQDNLRVDAPSGVIRGFDVRTGALRWAFDPVPPGWTPPADGRYTPGTPNAWAPLSGDPERGLVFVPMGNASPDVFNAIRSGLDYYGSSVVALSAETGQVVWRFQTVHQDVWDYDVPAQPVSFQLPGVGGGRPGVAQITKMGFLFLLDRETGQPLYPVEEQPVAQDGVPGEKLSPTQPFPTHPGPLIPIGLPPESAWGFTPIDRRDCRKKLEQIRNEGVFTPPSLEGSIVYPGNAGGPNWGGIALDPERGIAYVNSMRAPTVARLIPRDEADKLDYKGAVYPNELYPMAGSPYGLSRGPLLSSFGAPCVPPPWGTLQAVDLASGETLWDVSLGTTRDQAPWPLWFDLGAPNLGGPLATAGGLVFIGATTDKFFRAFDAASGDEIWRFRIPYTANSSPITYRLRQNGRQFVVVAAGGHGWSQPGDALMAFALPEGPGGRPPLTGAR
jgi:quinoprotein glucose dehydrogenase